MSDTTPHFERDATTGLVKGVEYKYKPDGQIDWKAMLNPVHIKFKTSKGQITTEHEKRLAAEIEKTYGAPAKDLVYADVVAKQAVKDEHLLVMLKGWQELAELRGFTYSAPTAVAAAPGMAVCAWSIKWIPNVDDPAGKETGATADATMENTGGFGYLGAMAGNRAFTRAVRLGLGVTILAADEIATKDAPIEETGVATTTISAAVDSRPVPTLVRYCKEANLSFDVIKAGAQDRYRAKMESDPSTWTQFEDVPARDCLTLISIIKDRTKGKTAKAA
jgi:hypothetical protein